MSEAFVDPRQNIDHPIEVGQVYTDSRTDERLHLVYKHEKVILLKSLGEAANSQWTQHRLETRKAVEQGVGAGRFKLDGEKEVDSKSIDSPDRNEPIVFEEIDRVGEKTANNLRREGYKTKGDVRSATDSELLEIGGVGETNLSNIKETIK